MNMIIRTHTRFFKLHRNAEIYCKSLEVKKQACEIIPTDNGFTVNIFELKNGEKM